MYLIFPLANGKTNKEKRTVNSWKGLLKTLLSRRQGNKNIKNAVHL